MDASVVISPLAREVSITTILLYVLSGVAIVERSASTMGHVPAKSNSTLVKIMGKLKKKTKPTGAAKSEESGPEKSPARRTKLSVTAKRSPNQISDSKNLGDEAEVPQSTLPRYPIVGIGASAGGLEALTQLLEPIPADTGVAIIIVQHLAPEQESVLSNLLSIHSQLPVLDVRDRVIVEPQQVYVVPPNTQLEIVAGKLKLSPRPEDRSQYRPIDFFLRSLATYAQTQSLGVILSGSDSDGAVGLQEIKAAGGITIARNPSPPSLTACPGPRSPPASSIWCCPPLTSPARLSAYRSIL